MPNLLNFALAVSPLFTIGAFGFAYWYFFVSLQREPAKVAKR